ncbi:hypothetical protein M885DRAFT_543108 [Pelagophyceae sp. CCMP2097]|nr:hypothetical protein M885DRAFT_543108 [Pelagophyceae sp. CCMP2097]
MRMLHLMQARGLACCALLLGVARGFAPLESAARPRRGKLGLRAARDLGLLPFGLEEVLLPGQARYLHFYESRFLSLFEHATSKNEGLVACGYFGGNRLVTIGTLAKIEAWERLDVGVGATIRGAGRIVIESLMDDEEAVYTTVKTSGLADERADIDDLRRAAEQCALAHAELAQLSSSEDIALRRADELKVDPRAFLTQADAAALDASDGAGLLERARALAATSALGDSEHHTLELASFLALEGCALDVKFEALKLTDSAARFAYAEAAMTTEVREISAKAAIKGLNLSWGKT